MGPVAPSGAAQGPGPPHVSHPRGPDSDWSKRGLNLALVGCIAVIVLLGITGHATPKYAVVLCLAAVTLRLSVDAYQKRDRPG